MVRLWGYARQVLNGPGLSIQEQRDKISEYVLKDPQAEYVGLTTDEGDGAKPLKFHDRPNANKLSLSMERGDYLVIAGLRYGFRSLRDIDECVRGWDGRGIGVYIVDWEDGDPQSWWRHLAEWEGAVRREEKRNIPRGGRQPYGWKWVGRYKKRKFVPDEGERVTIRWIMTLRREDQSYGEITDALRRSRLKFRRAGRYHAWNTGRVVSVVAAMWRDRPEWLGPEILGWMACSLNSTPSETPPHPDQTDQATDRSTSDIDHTCESQDCMSDSFHTEPLDLQTPLLLGGMPEQWPVHEESL